MAADTAMGGMDMDMGTTITTVTTIHTITPMNPIRMPTTLGTATITAMPPPLQPLQQRPVVAPCLSRWSPKGMYTAPTATTTTELAMGRMQRNPVTVRAEPVEARARSTHDIAQRHA